MYQKGDLLWIPAGTLLNRPRVPGKDDLFSNWHQTMKPSVALFMSFEEYDRSIIMLDGKQWSVETKNIRHNTKEECFAS